MADAAGRGGIDAEHGDHPGNAGRTGPMILGMGVIYLAVTVGMSFNRSLLQMDAGTQR